MRILHHPVRRRTSGKITVEYHVGRCSDCAPLYRVPAIQVSRVPDLYNTGNYSSFLDGKYTQGRRTKYERTMSAFGDLDDGRQRRLLDFGSGTGTFIELAIERGFDAYGVDLAPDAVTVANERLGEERTWCGSPLEVPQVREGQFDVITLWSVLAHFADPVEQLSTLRELLAPNGILLIYTVNANSLELKAYRDAWNGFTRNHLMFWEPASLPRLLRTSGFGGVAFRPFYPISVERTTWPYSEADRQRLVTSVDRYQNGNMMRAVAINGNPEASGIEGAVRL